MTLKVEDLKRPGKKLVPSPIAPTIKVVFPYS